MDNSKSSNQQNDREDPPPPFVLNVPEMPTSEENREKLTNENEKLQAELKKAKREIEKNSEAIRDVIAVLNANRKAILHFLIILGCYAVLKLVRIIFIIPPGNLRNDWGVGVTKLKIQISP